MHTGCKISKRLVAHPAKDWAFPVRHPEFYTIAGRQVVNVPLQRHRSAPSYSLARRGHLFREYRPFLATLAEPMKRLQHRGVGRPRTVDFHVESAPRVSHRFLSFTPGASPLVNSTPARSRTRRIAASVSGAPAYAPVSMLLSVLRGTPARSARSRTVQSSNPRAALICALVTSTSPGRPDSS
jgi:hypothetical protein